MTVDREEEREGFLRRWSRVKTESREAAEAPTPPAAPVASKSKAEDAPPELPAVDKLTLDSDFSAFFHPKVDESVRRQALRKLFSDPHFNVMDGLDVYIDDYSKSEPIPAAMLASLKQAQRILEWAADKKEESQVASGEAQPAESTGDPAALEAADTSTVPQQRCNDGEAQPVSVDAGAPSVRT